MTETSRTRYMPLAAVALAAVVLVGCKATAPPQTEPTPPTAAGQREAQPAVARTPAPESRRDRSDLDDLEAQVSALEASVADLQLRLIQSETSAVTLQTKLDAAIREAVRSKAKLQSVESRAEAASTIAEAEIALTARRESESGNPRLLQAAELLTMGANEFDNENYGGALYLAGEAKDLVSDNPSRLGADPSRRPDEVLFNLSLPLRVSRASNVRSGPGTTFEVLFVVDEGDEVIGHAYERQWVRITVADGRSGWIYSTLVDSRSKGSH